MTSLARIEANQRNCELSTGPRTAEGKAIVAKNAIRHGIFAAVPVLPDECPERWEAHRAGVVESLAPIGLLEVNLAERAALLLWRLQRLARYEAETVATAMESVEIPKLPPPSRPMLPHLETPPQKTREEQLREIREEIRTSREELANVLPARDYFSVESEAEEGSERVVDFTVGESILMAACARAETSENLRSDPPAVGSKPFLRKLGLTGTDPKKVVWTPDLIRRGLAYYVGFTEEPTERFVASLRLDLELWAEELTRKIRRLEREAAAIVRLLDGRTVRRKAAKLLPSDGKDERIAKYERHLHNLLTSTLHELERHQARREGEAVPPSTVADVNVLADSGPG